MSAEDHNFQRSLSALQLNIPISVDSDSVQWNKEWDKALHSLSAKDVYAMLSPIWNLDQKEAAEVARLLETLKNDILRAQNLVVDSWIKMELNDHFVAAWVLLEESDRQAHLLKGLEGAIKRSSLGEDARAMCPEIKISSMLKRNGKAYIDLLNSFVEKKKEGGEDNLCEVPSEWWKEATPDLQSQEVCSTFTLLTLLRNDFIIPPAHTMSILKDLAHGSTSMDPVVDILNSGLGSAVGHVIRELRDKPLIRCEKCTKTPEEIGDNIKFMLCSICKTKLKFSVHYCSQTCQKDDWQEHKKYCGKKKVTKQLRGTIRDPLWKYPNLPDFVYDMPMNVRDRGIDIASTGFGNAHPSRPHSQALQRQLSLLTGDKLADYFLFDEVDRPIRFVILDPTTKVVFRSLRADAMSSANQRGLEAITEYLIKMMQHKPGLDRGRILAQLGREYTENIVDLVTQWERMAAVNGHPEGTTFIEVMGPCPS